MDKLRAAARQALEYLDNAAYRSLTDHGEAITALREALAEPVSQEPVGYFAYDEEQQCWDQVIGKNSDDAVALYAAPVRTKDLTDDEILEITKRFALGIAFPVNGVTTPEMFARAVIAADREKNK